ncbi:MAG: efflux RND transporter periplasmic adaptor subunit [Verrucomicrobiota bacterium]
MNTKGVLLIGIVTVAWVSGCGRESHVATEPALPTAAVRVAKAEGKNHQAVEEVVGTVRAKVRTHIEAKVSGHITQLPVDAGQTVKAGELLAELDVQEIRAKLAQVKAVRQQADAERKRYNELLLKQATTPQEAERVQMQFLVAEATVQETEAMLGYGRVLAPFGGVITRKLAEVGDLAGPGRTLLELEDPATLRFEADVPEALLSRIQLGAKMPVLLSTLSEPLPGQVAEVEPVADPQSRTFLVKFSLPAHAGLRAGLFGRVSVPVGESTKIRVPDSAVVHRGQMECVFVTTGGRAQLRLVKTGRLINGEIELVSGLEAGELVVTEGAAALVDGQPLTIKANAP